jgi:hypothetical protein
MSSAFLKDDAALFLDDFGEDALVIVLGAEPRPIKVLVDWVAPVLSGNRKLEGAISIEAANDAVIGIDAATFDLGRTRIRLPERCGSAKMKDWMLSISEQPDGWADAGMLSFVLK